MIDVRWTETAIDDLVGIRDFIRRDSPFLAVTVVARLYESVDQLAVFPESGRIVPERNDPNLRELVRSPYRIVYELAKGTVHILTIFRSTRTFPEHLERVVR